MALGAPPSPSVGWAYFLDVDGTLVSIAPVPAAVRLSAATAEVVRALHARTGGAVALVSGRSIADVDAIFGPPQLPVAGQHGAERRGAGWAATRRAVDERRLDDARETLGMIAARHAGLLVEDKGQSLALHYRAAPALASFAHRTARALLRDLAPDFRLQRGKRVVELRPSGIDKGAAIAEFMREEPFRGRIPVFVGDDATDEDAFAVVDALGGHSVKVGPGRTRARWRLDDTDAVRGWLARALTDDADRR